jgi:uncharacterized protein (TIGR02246 family)
MADHPNEAVMRRLYTAFSAGDGEALAEILAPDIVWTTPGQSQIAGTYEGQDAVFKLFALCGELTEGTLVVTPESIKAMGDNTVVSVHRCTAHRADGATLDIHETETVTVEGGRITRMVESVDKQAAADAFWG